MASCIDVCGVFLKEETLTRLRRRASEEGESEAKEKKDSDSE